MMQVLNFNPFNQINMKFIKDEKNFFNPDCSPYKRSKKQCKRPKLHFQKTGETQVYYDRSPKF